MRDAEHDALSDHLHTHPGVLHRAEDRYQREDGGQPLSVCCEIQRVPQPVCRQAGYAGQLLTIDLVDLLLTLRIPSQRHEKTECEQLVLQRHLFRDAYERRMRPLPKLEVIAQVSPVVDASVRRAGIDGAQLDRGRPAGEHLLRVRRQRQLVAVGFDRHPPRTVRMLVGGPARWAVYRPDPRPTIGCDGGRVERRVLDVVTHRGDVIIAEGLDILEEAFAQALR